MSAHYKWIFSSKGTSWPNLPAAVHTQAEKWRLFEVKLPIEDDPGKDTHETSVALCSAVALKLKCKVKPPKLAHAALPSTLTCTPVDMLTVFCH